MITGCGSGQGRSASLLFAREGARIVGCDLDSTAADETARLVNDGGGRMVALAPVNCSDEAEVKSWIDFGVDTFGDFDILYNNASGCRFAPIEEMTRQEWDYTLANELTLVFLAVKHAVPVFRRRGGGVVLNTASTQGLRAGAPGTFAHSATKAGVIALTESMAVELASCNVRVNAVSPGLTKTPSLLPQIEEWGGEDRVRMRSLNHRLGQPADVANAAIFLCSDEAAHITGANLVVDGGAVIAPGAGRPSASPQVYAFH
ncbi:SDR family NAD(P)-dependent oxidoreductase [Prauserella sp. PE36]|uniref:SDR family NAD(P)-dependent oxidoreductase n=1 Tax=Prauserella sp. PE36 TaxID=1504709 RepID=UPI00210540BA|nr:SDR family NAD(P)-dependent oxidoreductase [Prauserella sp. PE36]